MNSIVKVVLAILGGCNVIFNLFYPLAIALLWILQFGTNHWGSSIVILLAILTTIYKSVDYLSIKEDY